MAGEKSRKDEDDNEHDCEGGKSGPRRAVPCVSQKISYERRITREPNVPRLPNTMRRNEYRRTMILSFWAVCLEIARIESAESSAAFLLS